jgi:hypothetical protein
MELLWLIPFSGAILITLFILKLKFKPALALLAGAAVLILPLSGGRRTLLQLGRKFLEPDSLKLLATLGLFGYYINLVRSGNAIKALITFLKRRVLNVKPIFFLIPTVLGWLINPGGVLLSVETCENLNIKQTKADNAKACMFFRHVQYPVLPLHPALMLLAVESGLGFAKFFWANLPVVIIAEIVGYWVYLRKVKVDSVAEVKPEAPDREVYGGLLSLITIIGSAIWFQKLELAMLLGILVFLAITGFSKTHWKDLYSDLIPVGIGCIAYNFGVSLNLQQFSGHLASVPFSILSMVLPALVSFASGSCLVGVSCSLPVVLSFPERVGLADFQALYFAALIGYYFSPVHLCSILARDYAKVSLSGWYYGLLKPVFWIGAGLVLIKVILKCTAIIWYN